MIYEIQSREENNVKILIKITKKENRIKQLQFSDGDIRYYIGEEQKKIGIEYIIIGINVLSRRYLLSIITTCKKWR